MQLNKVTIDILKCIAMGRIKAASVNINTLKPSGNFRVAASNNAIPMRVQY